MFGYLKPYDPELKGKHISEYKSYYCTLCYGLRINFGLLSSFLLNYECTFLLLLLDAISEEDSYEVYSFRCPVNPLKKLVLRISDTALEYTSFINYHLAVLKAYDGCVDTRGLKRAGYKVLHRALSRNKGYIRLRRKYIMTADRTTKLCEELYVLETSGKPNFACFIGNPP